MSTSSKEKPIVFLKNEVFKKVSIARNPVWISMTEQIQNFEWDGSSLDKKIDSFLNVLPRGIVLLATTLVWPLGIISLVEQVCRKIMEETWDTLTKKHDFDFLSSSVGILLAGIFWFIAACLCLPTVLLIPIHFLLDWLKKKGWPFSIHSVFST